MGGIIVVADTHFGIKKGSINMSMPGYFVDFLEWIKNLEEKEFKVKVVDGPVKRGKIKEKILYTPEKIVFLGDIFELWDSENQPVTACRSTVLPTLSEITAEKIYVLGNHDNILKRIVLENRQGEYLYYHLGKPLLRIFPDVYPPSKDAISTEKYGDEAYLFVHGHQFDKYFTESGGGYKIWSVIRNVSNSLTLYVPALFVLSFAVKVINWAAHTSIFLGENPTFGLLFLLTLPRIFMDIGRPLWNWAVGTTYKKRETVINFTRWWEKFLKTEPLPENVNVVYGHTHFLNYIPSPNRNHENEMLRGELYREYKKRLTRRKIPEKDMPDLINISAWVTDFLVLSEKFLLRVEKIHKTLKRLFSKRRKDRLNPELVTVATFLYIDEYGFEFFGWNWYSDSSPEVFHIPKDAIVMRREKGLVTDDESIRAVLKEVGWPDQMIELWDKDPHIQ